VSYFAPVFGDQVKYSFKRRMVGVFVLGLFLSIGCQSCKEDKKPDEVLSKKAMVRVLTEIYLTEEKVGRMGITRDSIEEIFPLFKERIFAKAAITDSVFKMSMDYYMAHPEELEFIYTALVDTLSFRAQAAAVADTVTKKNVLPQ
jgi:hypothetical protein